MICMTKFGRVLLSKLRPEDRGITNWTPFLKRKECLDHGIKTEDHIVRHSGNTNHCTPK